MPHFSSPRLLHILLQLPFCDSASLNASQVEAVRLCLAAQNVALIHGPPGTGKRPLPSLSLAPKQASSAFLLALSGKTSTVAVAIQALVARGTDFHSRTKASARCITRAQVFASSSARPRT